MTTKECFDIVKKRTRTSFLLISRFFLKLGANYEPAAHRQCARDAKSFKSTDGKAEILICPPSHLMATNILSRCLSMEVSGLH